jgi:hypothetical protein
MVLNLVDLNDQNRSFHRVQIFSLRLLERMCADSVRWSCRICLERLSEPGIDERRESKEQTVIRISI